MKIRLDYVTNSSSSSYIICFARIADENKAKKIINKHQLDILSEEDVRGEMYYGDLGADWCGAIIWGADKILKEHPDDKYIIIEDWNDADYDEDSCEPIYYDCFDMDDAIEEITEENGFTDIDIAYGEGRNG